MGWEPFNGKSETRFWKRRWSSTGSDPAEEVQWFGPEHWMWRG